MTYILEPRHFAIRVGRNTEAPARWVVASSRTAAFAKLRAETGATDDLFLMDERDKEPRREAA